MDDLRAEPREIKHNKKERRLAYEIALGIYIGGIALALTSWLFWFIVISVMAGKLKFG